jgi:hypothetical protein
MQHHIDHDEQDRFPTDPSGLPEAGGSSCWNWLTATRWTLESGRWPSGWASPRCGC